MAINFKKKRKYKNKKIFYDGYWFESIKEKVRYVELRLLERAGLITGLTMQPRFVICEKAKDIDGKTLRTRFYYADFAYTDDSGESVVEDVKSKITAVEPKYRLKRQIFLSRYSHLYKFVETLR